MLPRIRQLLIWTGLHFACMALPVYTFPLRLVTDSSLWMLTRSFFFPPLNPADCAVCVLLAGVEVPVRVSVLTE